MYSESCRTIAAMLNGYISSCSPEQVQELKQLLIDTISDIENGNLTQEKSTDSTAENEHTEPERQRAPKIHLTDSLIQLIYNTAKKFPNDTYAGLEKRLNLTNGYIKNQRRTIVFKGRKTKLSTVVKLARLMDGNNLRRYEREEDYTEE